MSHWYDDENENARVAFGELKLGDRLRQALLYENGLPPTNSAILVLAEVNAAMDKVDERWSQKNLPDSPSVTDYAAAAIERLKRQFSGPGVML